MGFFCFLFRVFSRRERKGKKNSLFDDKKNTTHKKKQLTSRLAERDGQLSSLREEVELYDGRIQRLEDALDARTAELLALRRAAAEREDGEEEEPRQQRRRQQQQHHQQQQHPPPLPLPSTAAAAVPSVKTAAERFAAVSLTARAVDETLPPAPAFFAETFANPASSSSRPRSPAAAAPSPVAFVAQPPSLPSSSSSRRAGGDAAGQDVLRRLLG